MDTNVPAAAAPLAGPRAVLNAEHEMFRDAVRRFFERHVAPHHRQWERDGVVPRSVWLEAGAHGPPLAPHSIPLGGEAEEQRMIATVLPLAGGKAAGLVRGGAAGAAVFLQDPSAAAPGPSDAFAALHGLTRAEARFLAALAAGRTVPEASDHLGISQATGRTHLTRIFGKTGTSRQPELVRLMLASAPPLRHG